MGLSRKLLEPTIYRTRSHHTNLYTTDVFDNRWQTQSDGKSSQDLFDGWFMVFNATFNNISVISWRSVLLVEETTDLSQVTDKLSHNVALSTPHHEQALVVIGTDCIGSCKSNYHTIMTMTAPTSLGQVS